MYMTSVIFVNDIMHISDDVITTTDTSSEKTKYCALTSHLDDVVNNKKGKLCLQAKVNISNGYETFLKGAAHNKSMARFLRLVNEALTGTSVNLFNYLYRPHSLIHSIWHIELLNIVRYCLAVIYY